MNLRDTITPKSDQLNADDLINRTLTITITELKKGSAEQPITVHYEGDNGHPYKPSKSMRRVLVNAWGDDGAKYAGRSMTLFCEPTLKFGGQEVGGIRISHLSDIDGPVTTKITVRRGVREDYTVHPLVDESGDAAETLRDCKTLDALRREFLKLPKPLQAELEAVKDEMKAVLEGGAG